MKLKHLLLTTSLCAMVAAPGWAKSRNFSEIDQNKDGALSLEELEAAFSARGARAIMKRSDLNGDGLITPSEIQVSQDDEHDDDENDDEDDDENDDENDDDENDDERDDHEDDEHDERDDDERDDDRDDDERDRDDESSDRDDRDDRDDGEGGGDESDD
ncbi:EF-hand domain-containing protein [Aliiroseovarius crassostreae]|uniref:EF-hand domain-containing protein n=1 Tax=Aliiroseovarius crassostreae TaxID=154981 RepID=A0A9Q9H840_9RHOB|nr:EF-hand domain-containing protein [Aliiroseovarius crassostreae]UWP94633.1 EF-hand domain-containing protein [Aliiroseovarius crassostreae]UWQ00959.1 EF-hand domain-containing protein [Aliiroseovarius crassostreae]